MSALPVIAVFDVGKTNKKLFLLDEQYKIVFERTARFIETTDEDGDPCDHLESLSQSVFDSLKEVSKRKEFSVKAINFATYGASFVYIDEQGNPLTPLYNYLKTYPESLSAAFYKRYGGKDAFSRRTASPALGSLNSGLQLYRLKMEQPEVFSRVKYALHLPQYLSFLISGMAFSDVTSIGCHTGLWDFERNDYHLWVKQEGVFDKLAPIGGRNWVVSTHLPENPCAVGIGLHDSSAALIPYLIQCTEPFVLISTGTWCITLNPFNHTPLSAEELEHDCLCYMTHEGRPVKASRLFAGQEHEDQLRRIAAHFGTHVANYKNVEVDTRMMGRLIESAAPSRMFADRDLGAFVSDIEAYHQLMLDITRQQVVSTRRVLGDQGVTRLFVDGGFSKNALYMHLLAIFFPELEVFAASTPQATAVGAALAIHAAWNSQALPNDLVDLKSISNP